MISEFYFQSRVYYSDTDAGGVVYHSKYLDFCEKARTEFLRDKGIIQSKILESDGIGFVVKDCQIEFKKSAKLDDLLFISVKILENKGLIIKMNQNVFNEKKELLFTMNVNLVCVNRNSKPTKILKVILEILNK